MANEGHILTGTDFARVGSAVGYVERRLHSFDAPPDEVFQSPITHDLQIQAGAANSFGYPARIQKWSDSAGTWSDFDTTEVRVEDPNGGSFAASDYVPNARLVGVNTSGVACFSAPARAGALTAQVFHLSNGLFSPVAYPGVVVGSISLPAGTHQLFLTSIVSTLAPAPTYARFQIHLYYVSGAYQLRGPVFRDCWVPPAASSSQSFTHHWDLLVTSACVISIRANISGANFYLAGGGDPNGSQLWAYKYA